MSKYNFISSGMDEEQEKSVRMSVMSAFNLLPEEDADKLHRDFLAYRDSNYEQGNAILPAWLYFKNRIQVIVKEESAQ